MMSNKFRPLHVALVLLSLLLISSAAFAQEAQPGDPCVPAEEHRFQHVGGPENPGTGYTLVCDGAEWKLVTEWSTSSGQSLFQVGNDTDPCDSDKTGRLRYDSGADEWEYCNGSAWGPFEHAATGGDTTPDGFDFTDLTNQNPVALVTSDPVQITGISPPTGLVLVGIITGNGTPEYRTCSDGSSQANCNSTVIEDWTDSDGSIRDNDYIQLRHFTASAGNTQTTEFTVGTYTANWQTTSTDCLGGSGTQSYTTPGQYTFTLPTDTENCAFTITVRAAGGGAISSISGGDGGGTEFSFNPNGVMDVFNILVGGGGRTDGTGGYGGGGTGRSSGGGGASAVMHGSVLLAISGGGGAAGSGGNGFDGAGGNNAGAGGSRGGSNNVGGDSGSAFYPTNGGSDGSDGDTGGQSPQPGGTGYPTFTVSGGAGAYYGGGGGGYGGGGGGEYPLGPGGGGGGYLNIGILSSDYNVISGGAGGSPGGNGENGSVTFYWE